MVVLDNLHTERVTSRTIAHTPPLVSLHAYKLPISIT